MSTQTPSRAIAPEPMPPETGPNTMKGGKAQHEPLPGPIPAPVVDAAITWSVKLDYNQATPATLRAFEQWLNADPLHAQAWERIGSLRCDFTKLPPQLALDTLQTVEALRRKRSI